MNGVSLKLGCSAFCLRNGSDTWIARNLDVPFTNGHILTNLRGISKQSIIQNHLFPAHWISRWGSLTINLLGADFPMGGINECGLVIEHLWMPGTEYPDHRGCKALLEFEWIQFMLDTCTSVEDVRIQAEQLTIPSDRVEMHFLLADSSGNYALLEFRNGKPLFYTGSFFQTSVVTNSWYDESLRYMSSFAGFGGESTPSRTSTESLDRFARLACAIYNKTTAIPINIPDSAMSLLDSVIDDTLLSVVFHPQSGCMTFKTSQNDKQRTLKTADFDFSPDAHHMMLDIHAETDTMENFNAEKIILKMQDIFSIGQDFLRLDAYQNLMISRQKQISTTRYSSS
ncbi:carcinine hydrolase/isopenicillin-N N-acyltransferase family protein [Desulfobotulus mexicanus]|uniref:Linear amide C-N hydrolase n=1 Tax=Desulfobotulus mexicanus TaxID=2586642 RepID=A0A5Q4VCA4_9BACT|nr:linear amide C-N hydrolase [Desulfobotulus mexicanus]TYT75334.1 linear amide C-N hydrolase [Desulfobotulus mexicanus]